MGLGKKPLNEPSIGQNDQLEADPLTHDAKDNHPEPY